MNAKEVAERLRALSDDLCSLQDSGVARELDTIANELDPSRPEPGTVVWWRYKNHDVANWFLGKVSTVGVLLQFGTSERPHWSQIEWKPAHILAPDEVAVKVPPVKDWPADSDEVDLRYSWHSGPSTYTGVTITRAEAERMEKDA